MKIKGWISLDIDGTITLDKHSVPETVVRFLRELSQKGWRIALATGRSFTFAQIALRQFDFPYLFLPQNGSIALKMPGKEVLFRRYLSPDVLPVVEEALEGFETDFLLYRGMEHGDLCCWRPHRLCGDDLAYAHVLQLREREEWQVVDSFDPAKIDPFPLLKVFGPFPRLDRIAERLRGTSLFEIAKISDIYHDSYGMLLITHPQATKGEGLKEVFERLGRGRVVIGAGDDANDVSLLEVSDIKIAMSHAPAFLRDMADFIAPPTSQEGIIQALQMALSKVSL